VVLAGNLGDDAKVVEWSEEDQCYVGSAPGLILGGCHGEDERGVFDELCRIVDEAIGLYQRRASPEKSTDRTTRNASSR